MRSGLSVGVFVSLLALVFTAIPSFAAYECKGIPEPESANSESGWHKMEESPWEVYEGDNTYTVGKYTHFINKSDKLQVFSLYLKEQATPIVKLWWNGHDSNGDLKPHKDISVTIVLALLNGTCVFYTTFGDALESSGYKFHSDIHNNRLISLSVTLNGVRQIFHFTPPISQDVMAQ